MVPQPAQLPPGHYSGFWSIDGEGTHALLIIQAGETVSGNEMESSFSIGTITGTVHGNKLKAKIVGDNFTRTYKVKLTDAEHFTGKRITFIDGQKKLKESVSATEVT